MPTCSDCKVSYPKLSGDKCGHCIKGEGKHGDALHKVQNAPYCRACSIVYKEMDGLICADSDDGDDGRIEEIEANGGASSHTVLPATTQHLLSRVEHHSSTASDHRLTKPAKNHGLQKADNYKFLKQKAYGDAVKKMSGTTRQTASKDVTFIICLYMYNLKNRLVKLPIDSLNVSAKPTVKVNKVLELALSRAQEAFLKNPQTRDHSTPPKFDLENVEFSSLKSKNLASRAIVFDEESLSLTLSRYFENLKAGSMLSENLVIGKRKKDQEPRRRSKRFHFSESDDDEPSVFSSPPAHAGKSERVTRSTTRNARVALEVSAHVVSPAADEVEQEDTGLETLEPFMSPYHCRPRCQPIFDLSNYDMHIFCCVLTTVIPNGEIFLHQSNIEEAILVHKNWPLHRNALKGPMDGYLGKGVQKYAFKGYIGNSQFAVFLLGGLHFMSGVEDAAHSRMIREEYLSLIKADYHLKAFKECASCYHVQLPVEDCEAMPPLSYGAPDTRTMHNTTFFAAPFLDFTGRTEIHFTGGDGVPRDHKGEIDDIIAAFTHSTLIDSSHTVIVTDIQGNQAGNWWDGDKGRDVINSFLAAHICNNYCCRLRLEGASPKSIPPLTTLPIPQSSAVLTRSEVHPLVALSNMPLQATGHAVSAIRRLQVPPISGAQPATPVDIGDCMLPPFSQLVSALPATPPHNSSRAKGRGPLRTGKDYG
ncbi:hypothetical protein M422DRAFT_269524 [Sphaerobolus stellatus SS14]|uniref:Alpha-type protein kinase domain-containing protein n=1 Tax=Sphaerobolus stellatus (strain SS14) TaxID=990650 RepID=A0A0C9THW8_SPHS4|nr:hypothetical protein M422DRAFT_269524 [Sphaerobolus stellatus SS14]